MNEYREVYPYSRHDARERGELDRYIESRKENVACKQAIEEEIRQHFDGMHLDSGCAERIVEQFGLDRVIFVLSNTLDYKDWDGRFNQRNRDWAHADHPMSPDIDVTDNFRTEYVVDSHPAVLDGFISDVRKIEAQMEAEPIQGPQMGM